ncbi:MAG: hypothetical protein FWH07_04745 [Oscillospiraceae bacterium]|nr:hypothetical protein [Oscillospiraceae bacterium]
MKKIITISVLTVALLLTACSSPEIFTENESDTEVASENPSDDLFTVARLAQVKKHIDIVDTIFIGEFIEDTEQEFSYMYSEYFKKDIQIGAYTYSKLLVTEVFKGDVKPGDIITVGQRYGFDDERNALISFSELTPMNAGDRWIHLGGFGDDGIFYNKIRGGRYPVPSKEILRLGEDFMRRNEKINELASRYSLGITRDEFLGEIGLPNGDGEYILTVDFVVCRFGPQEEWDKVLEQANVIWDGWENYESIDTLTLGRFEREDFNFWLYVQILNYLQVEAEDWVNPGRESDAKLAEMEIIDLWKLTDTIN